ncbi:hypothetical protein CTI12_AA605910 [Artemisia annua]|uniref:ATPase F1/V1/A1 complex alpha/beta subunit N-terminal domain-containing protein n=1 Tax=Artemisia annua TaxID=35608 RepID=A0A2U1KGA4_ARTAN|nr:hypothetical protein CTI12_AA605910 [Artemisia annua]
MTEPGDCSTVVLNLRAVLLGFSDVPFPARWDFDFQVDEIGRVVSVGDGIARFYGLNEIQAGDLVF